MSVDIRAKFENMKKNVAERAIQETKEQIMATEVAVVTDSEKNSIFDKLNKHDIDLNTIVVKQTAMDLIVAEIKADLKEIREVLINRPTWQVTLWISGLGALCLALLTALIMLRWGPVGH